MFIFVERHRIENRIIQTDRQTRLFAFVEKQKLPFDLLADVKGAVIKAFGVPHRGKFASRQAYLFKDGKLVWKDEKASTGGQGEDLLKALDGLK